MNRAGPPGGLGRRRFLAGAGAATLALSGLDGILRGLQTAAAALPTPAISPSDPAVRATIAAFADTIVPGPAGGADRAPGAIEAGVLEEVYDPFYGAVTAFPLLHDDLVLQTPLLLARPATFDLELPYRERERVLTNRMLAPGQAGTAPLYLLYQGVGALVYLSYYGTARSTAGPRYIGLPPTSDGYYPRHTYKLRFRGMTADGNPD